MSAPTDVIRWTLEEVLEGNPDPGGARDALYALNSLAAEVAALRADLAEAKAEHAAVQEKYAKELARYYHKNRALRADRDAAREAGQALRDAFPDSSWQGSRERADAADEWDELVGR